jgi:acyl carrier protein
MSTDEILESLRKLMIDVFDLDDLRINAQTTADDVEDWDSLSHIRLMVAIERQFKIKFQNSEIEALTNVGELVQVIARKIG